MAPPVYSENGHPLGAMIPAYFKAKVPSELSEPPARRALRHGIAMPCPGSSNGERRDATSDIRVGPFNWTTLSGFEMERPKHGRGHGVSWDEMSFNW